MYYFRLNVKLIFTSLLIILLTGCFTGRKAGKEKAKHNDYLIHYISQIAAQNKITDSPLLVIDGNEIEYNDYVKNYPSLKKSDVKQIDYLSADSETALKVYGDRAQGGVLLILTNKNSDNETPDDKDGQVLLLMDNRQISKKELEKINPADIESIEVIRKEKAIRKFTKENYDGVIIIRMKGTRDQ